ncbi:hypothetical protein [Streptomyces sp. NPDC091212]|uniref:hypothetical protein n=1 Tax=Streptomyces sp. NPDC091212 TaxID=3155191 RepID=UPI00341D2221
MSQQPTVGRTVHYVSHGTPVRPDGTQAFPSRCRAAIVTEVPDQPTPDNRVGLQINSPDGPFSHPLSKDGGVPQDEPRPFEDLGEPYAYAGGSWHWPERV